MTTDNRKMSDEFKDFLSASEIAPPAFVRDAIVSRIHRDLDPSNQHVFLKMLGVHTLVSLFSLSVCSQFGIQSLRVYDAMNSMMDVVGHTYCMALCGILYLGLSALALSLWLKPEEIRVIRRHRFFQLTLLAGVSLGVFLCLGANVLFVPGALWLVGSVIGGIASFELGWMIRSKFRHQLIFGN